MKRILKQIKWLNSPLYLSVSLPPPPYTIGDWKRKTWRVILGILLVRIGWRLLPPMDVFEKHTVETFGSSISVGCKSQEWRRVT